LTAWKKWKGKEITNIEMTETGNSISETTAAMNIVDPLQIQKAISSGDP
jgi:hypothetical protein